MSSFVITCPQCKQQLSALQAWVGTEVECPFCRHIILVQAPGVQQNPQVRIQPQQPQAPQFQQPQAPRPQAPNFQQPQIQVVQPQQPQSPRPQAPNFQQPRFQQPQSPRPQAPNFQQPQVQVVQPPQYQQPQVQVVPPPKNVKPEKPRKPVNKKAVALWCSSGAVAVLLCVSLVFGLDLDASEGIVAAAQPETMAALTAESGKGYPSKLGNSRFSRIIPFDIGTPLYVVKKNSVDFIHDKKDENKYIALLENGKKVIIEFDASGKLKYCLATVSQDDFQPLLDYLVDKYGKTNGTTKRDENYADLVWKLYSENVKIVYASSDNTIFIELSALE